MEATPGEVTLIAIATAMPGKEARLREVTENFAKSVAEREPNTTCFEVHEQEIDGQLRFALLERYKTKADLDAHLKSPEVAALWKTFKDEDLTTEPGMQFVGHSTAGYRSR